MGESHENLLKAVRHYQDCLDKYTENRNDGKLLHYLEKLYRLPIKVIHLEQTGVGRTVNGLRKLGGEVGDSAKSLVAKWKEMVVGEQEQEEDDEEDDEEEDDEEDGYQTGEEQSNDSDDKDGRDEKTKSDTSSSHRKSDSHRSEDRDKSKKSKHSSTKSDQHEDSSKSRKDKKHHKHNGHLSSSSKHKSHKRKIDDSSSDEESTTKRQKREISSEDEDRHKYRRKNESDSETDSKSKEKKHRSDEEKKKYKSKKSRDSSSDLEESHKANKIKEKYKDNSSKDKHKSSKKDEEKKHEHSKKTKEKDKKSETSKSKDAQKEVKNKEKTDDKKHKSSKNKSSNLSNYGIDSGSGASFAEALGMCEPSSSKNNSKKKSSSNSNSSNNISTNNINNNSEKKEKSTVKTEDAIPKLLKEPIPIPEPLDINISSLLPPITPNYRPLGNLINTDVQPKKFMTDYEALSSIITSKNQRTKVYSGNKTGCGKVPSLFELCIRVLQDNIDALEYTGGVPYNVLKPILEKSTPNQLYVLEHHNPYLIEDTDELWQLHCQKEFRNKKREEFESWREMYLRCLDERDAKLKALTANIKQAQDKSLPVRTTKLAYVDAVAKPPRNIARKQAKNGTAVSERKPTAAKLSQLATAGEAGKVAVPNPGARAAERSGSSHAVKPKKAPLMLKSISSFKNRFKR